MRLITSVLDLIFPPRCVFCRSFVENGDDLICPDCREKLPYTEDAVEKRGEAFSVCAAPLYYEGVVRDSLHRYKFHGASHYAETYGLPLAECIEACLNGRWDLISWVPLSKKRFQERGYDQAKLLADAAAGELRTPVKPVSTLEKVKDVEKQSLMGSPEQRRANIAGAYCARNPQKIAGKRILLIDDIVTTGATLSECARTLIGAGAAGVLCAALARTRD